MTTSVTFALIDALIDRWTPVLDVNVLDGYGLTDDPGDFLMVGADDPDDDKAVSAEFRQEWHGLGANARLEEGSVQCLALSWNGDADPRAARHGVEATTNAVENHLRADPNLGGTVPGLMWAAFAGIRGEIHQMQGETGAAAWCVFDVAFKARLTA